MPEIAKKEYYPIYCGVLQPLQNVDFVPICCGGLQWYKSEDYVSSAIEV